MVFGVQAKLALLLLLPMKCVVADLVWNILYRPVGQRSAGVRVEEFSAPGSLETSFRLCLEAFFIFVARVGVEFVVFLVVVDFVWGQCVMAYVLPRGCDFDVCCVVYAHDADGFAGPSASDVEAV